MRAGRARCFCETGRQCPRLGESMLNPCCNFELYSLPTSPRRVSSRRQTSTSPSRRITTVSPHVKHPAHESDHDVRQFLGVARICKESDLGVGKRTVAGHVMTIAPATRHKCPRCRLSAASAANELCERCSGVVSALTQ